MLLGITNPHSFEIPDYLGYDITKLKSNFRCLEVVLARKGQANGICPLYFDGAINTYKELPKANSPEMQGWYNKVNTEPLKPLSAKSYTLLGVDLDKINIKNSNLFKKLFKNYGKIINLG